MVRKTTIRLTSCIVLSTALVTFAFGAVAGAKSASGAIAPHQTFIGLVNGDQVKASVDVDCPGPARLGQMGHPAGGQTLGVSSPAPAIAWTGNTGSRGRSITAGFVTASAAATPTVTFSHYGSQPLPTTGMLPCSGSGSVVFTPSPTSHSAGSSKVSITYVATCTNPCPVVEGRPASGRTRHGVIAGQLGYEGGAYPGKFHRTAGVVDVAGPKNASTVTVPASGRFTLAVTPGSYTLTGCGGTNDKQCGPPQDVTVKAQKTSHVQVPWLLAP